MYRSLEDYVKKNIDLTVSEMLNKAECLGISTIPRHKANKSRIYKMITKIENGTAENQTLCWCCKNNNCDWLYEHKPIDGWVAYPTVIDNKCGRITNSYMVLSCPQFKQGRIL